jgi:hypothetical protein
MRPNSHKNSHQKARRSRRKAGLGIRTVDQLVTHRELEYLRAAACRPRSGQAARTREARIAKRGRKLDAAIRARKRGCR